MSDNNDNLSQTKSVDPNMHESSSQNAPFVWSSLVPLLLIFGVFYFLLIRPQEKKRKEQENLVNAVKKGDKVITSSGIYGTVVKIDDSEGIVELEIAKNVQVKLLKTSILDVIKNSNVSKALPKTASKSSSLESKNKSKKVKNAV